MSTLERHDPYAPTGAARALESAGAALLAILWVLPLAYAIWAAFHPAEFTTRFTLLAPLTLQNFERAWAAAPFARYFLNTFVLVTLTLGCQLVLCTLAAYAFARYDFAGSVAAAGAAQGLRAARKADLRRLRPRFGQLPLEQLPLAVDRHQLGRGAALDRRPAGVLLR
jgi:hypothetical protein